MFSKSWISTLISLTILLAINLLMVSSLAPDQLGKQILSWFIGALFFLIGTQINPKQTASIKWLIFAISCSLLATPILLNQITRGSRRWIMLGPLTFQPTEVVKPWLMLFLATTKLPLAHLLPVAIIALQPDLGSALSTLVLIIPIVLYNKKLLRTGLIALLCLLLASPLLWKFVLHDYQQNRIQAFVNPSADPLGQGYNLIQSQIAIGYGGLWGRGYKKGTQGQLLFLPEKHTDFVFAATTEELGLVGAVIILGAYFLLIKTLTNKAYQSQDRTHFLFTLGISIQIWTQAFINIAMNLGLLPVTGIPLPFLSVGGSSLISLLFSLGIIYSS